MERILLLYFFHLMKFINDLCSKGLLTPMILKIEIRSGIGKLSVNSKSDESAGIGRIGSKTQIFSKKCLFFIKKNIIKIFCQRSHVRTKEKKYTNLIQYKHSYLLA
jgi:hypothetical protein